MLSVNFKNHVFLRLDQSIMLAKCLCSCFCWSHVQQIVCRSGTYIAVVSCIHVNCELLQLPVMFIQYPTSCLLSFVKPIIDAAQLQMLITM